MKASANFTGGAASRARAHVAAFAVALAVAAVSPLAAEDTFGFGDVTESDGSGSGSSDASGGALPGDALPGGMSAGSSAPAVTLSGELGPRVTAFVDEIDSWSSIEDFGAGALASGTLKVAASGANADALAAIDFSARADGVPEVSFDEAYVRAYFGKLDLETGLRKVTWGKADSSGPLDVVNPLDLSDLTVTDSLKRKMARPMLRATYSLGDFTALEAIFEPSFAGHKLSLAGPWAPSQMTSLPKQIASEATDRIPELVKAGVIPGAAIPTLGVGLSGTLATADLSSFVPEDTSTLEYSQGGVRLTTTVGSSDIGIQYWYGYLPRPAVSVDVDKMLKIALAQATVKQQKGEAVTPADLAAAGDPFSAVSIGYNRFHQIGADYASVFGKFNVRAELAANITEDTSGDDGEVYNPSIGWSLGFDRDLFASINLNAQACGSVRLLDGEVGDGVSDVESGADLTHTTVTAKLSRTFLKDEFELSLAGMYGIEDADFIALPSIVWTKGDVKVKLEAGIFGGDEDGELGQFGDNDYATLSLTYSF